MLRWPRKTQIFWTVLPLVIATDVITKMAVVRSLTPHVPHQIVGELVRFTLSFNQGAAMNLSVGAYNRVVFTLLALIAIGVLAALYRSTTQGDTWRSLGLALVMGGSIGNLVDRLRWSRGVVDFIDVGLGNLRFWTFNVADACITTGAVVLILVLSADARRHSAATPPVNSAS